ncbi:hypothetical protein ACJRO7_027711 [Eucalyptus globulus]|uniref:CCHC-type domain-containing protein n=1 Tax=Eucalyptus globulus TaxID=34317 RepID=A0ABD3JVU1_EUCGL
MDFASQEGHACLAALCTRLGRLWFEQDIDVWDEAAPTEKLAECQLILVGKVLSNPSINFQAFQNTLKRAWRTDQVEITQREEGLYVFKFTSVGEKQRVLDNSPWLFSSHLVIVKPWVPNTPLHCYDFSTCAFWVQVLGLPLECYTEEMISNAVRNIGKVHEVKIESKEGTTLRAGRARVELNLQEPLKPGKHIRLEGRNFWLDFRYEHLSHYCYSCGVLGHYAMYCKDIPYDDVKMDGKDKLYYGQWLRAEVQEHSPFWRAFYEPQPHQDGIDEIIPETPQHSTLLLPITPHSTN